MSLNKVISAHWALLERHPTSARLTKAVNGHRLDISTVMLVSRYDVPVEIAEETYLPIDRSAKVLEAKAESAEVIYGRLVGFAPRSFDFTSILGIKTGFGGSANTQTKAAIKLKEDLLSGLQYVNGTSVSVAIAALAMHEALGLAALSQVLTAMSVEVLLGTDESFDPFLATVRPYWG
ncbi:MAG: hypothetical protein LQ352_004111 [Teloschistes flavicans]|nr:MAG: hypothetical protein LQ352_004111 [Teloschistes flavicans]